MSTNFKKQVWIAAACLLLSWGGSAAETDDYAYSARNRVYAYFLVGHTHVTPLGAWRGWGGAAIPVNGLTPTVGAGFSLFDLGQRLFINLEADFSFSGLNTGGFQTRTLNTWTFMLQAEYRFRPRISVFGGLGVGILHQKRDPARAPGEFALVIESVESAVAWELGMKVTMSRHLMLRAGFRMFNILLEYGDREYCVDCRGVRLSDYESDLYATSFMAGLEIHF